MKGFYIFEIFFQMPVLIVWQKIAFHITISVTNNCLKMFIEPFYANGFESHEQKRMFR